MKTLPLTLRAPAKVNLSLKIKGKREDGFHEMETVMIPLELADELVFEPSGHFIFSCGTPGVPVDESNLVVRAVRLFEQKTGVTVSLHIRLVKNVPHGAGLGGGSSDAAFALLGLNDLYETGLSLGELAVLAGELGSDVPFFLYETMSVCTGRGEKIQPLFKSLKWNILLAKPAFGVSTPDAYRRWASSSPLKDVLYDTQEWEGELLSNDLERPVFEKHLFLPSLKMWMLRQEETGAALMSGSGSTLFAVCSSAEKCERLAGKLKNLDKNLWVWVGLTH